MSNNIQEQSLQFQQGEIHSDEIDIKDLIGKLIKLKNLFFQKFKTILLFSVLGGLLGLGYASLSKPIYTAKLTFVMRSDATNAAASGLAGLSSLLGSGTSAASSSPLDRIIELLGSEQIIGKALLTESNVNNNSDLMINHIIRIAKLTNSWSKDTVLSKVNFKIGDKFDNLNFSQRKAIKSISYIVAGPKGMLNKSFDKKSGIIQMSVVYNHEELSIQLNRAIYNELVKFYTNESVSSIASKVAILQAKVDSIQGALNYTQEASALKTDQGLGLLLQQDRVDQKRLGLRESVLTLMYGEAQKNLEQLNFILATTSPSFSIIDQPFSPIKPQTKSKLVYGFMGIFLFGFFSFLYFIASRWFKKFLD
jgi:uncharacterized protein involved in exopolysaccharide biosynthesis